MAVHSYNVEIAVEYGIEEAILIHHFAYWIGGHASNNINLRDGRYWSYDKAESLYKILPEFKNKKRIEYCINKLVEKDILMKGNFNELKFDRTLWYTFTDNGLRLIFEHGILTYECMSKIIEEVSKVSDFDFPFLGNGNTNNGVTITHNNHHNKDTTHFVRSSESKSKNEIFDLTFIDPTFVDVVTQWLAYKKERKQSYKSANSIRIMYKNLVEWSGGNPDVARGIVELAIGNNWQGIQPIRQNNQGTMSRSMQDTMQRMEEARQYSEMLRQFSDE
jgi:hypothetical protein